MKKFDFATFDVFSDQPFAGNQLAVIFDADCLSTEEMLAITREFNYAESVFVLKAKDPKNAARIRIFTIGYEMPFAGHPTVGSAVAISERFGIKNKLSLELNTGMFPIKLFMQDGASFAEFQNPNLPKEAGPAPDAAAIEDALSLPRGAIDRDANKPRFFGAGVNFLYAKASLETVRRARVSADAFDKLALGETVGVLLYAEGGDAENATHHVRMFAPGAGVVEDAATGSAAAAFPGKIAVSERLCDGAHRWVVEQGVEMGRPSKIHVSFDVADGAVESVRIAGAVTPVMKGVLEF
ncbi:MAG: PhzF family phenazine biosynthesis protein [Parvularculaceae bacterium]